MDYLGVAEKQLYLWVKGIIEHTADCAEGGGDERLHAAMYSWLLQHDFAFARINFLPDDIKKRERYFLGNSINGMSGFVPLIEETRRRDILDRAGLALHSNYLTALEFN